MPKTFLLALIISCALATTAFARDYPSYYPKQGTQRTGKIDAVYIDEGRIVINDRPFKLSDDIVGEIVRRTEGVSPAFIKELMRRSVQFHIEQNGNDELSKDDVTCELDEMLVAGGSLNLKLLGATELKEK